MLLFPNNIYIDHMIKMNFGYNLCDPFAINWIDKMHREIESKTT